MTTLAKYCYTVNMIIGVDIGGTKTYLAAFSESGKLLNEVRFETPRNYEDFLSDLKTHAEKLDTKKAKIACIAVPGLLDRKRGVVLSLGNLPWKDRHIQQDCSNALQIKKVIIENDSKLAGLAESRMVAAEYSRVFYLTISTGIGGALLINGKLSQDVIDMEIGKTPILEAGKIQAWEDFASGRAFFETYGQKAVDVTDEKIWKKYSNQLNAGIGMICSNYQVDAIIFGGGLGQRLGKFKPYISDYIEASLHPIVKKPKALLSTHYRGQSVVYGCYHYAKDNLA